MQHLRSINVLIMRDCMEIEAESFYCVFMVEKLVHLRGNSCHIKIYIIQANDKVVNNVH